MKWSSGEKKLSKDKCTFCRGKGYTDFGKCDICRGSGKNKREKSK